MSREFAKSFYRSKEWRKCRQAYYIMQHGQCELCGGIGNIVHHKIWINPNNINDPDVTLNWENLQLVCIEEHNKIHMSKNDCEYVFDANGDLVPKDR